MQEIEERLLLAKEDTGEMNRLLTDYLPYIKKQLGGNRYLSLEFDDKLSIAMLTFVSCVRQYKVGRGGFLSFYQTALKNRLIDEGRRQQRHASRVIPLDQTGRDGEEQPADNKASLEMYRREEERSSLALEIDSFHRELSAYGITFAQLEMLSPKQKRSRAQCLQLAQAITENEAYLHMLTEQKRVPQTELAAQFSISPKTIEKHRKYIVVLSLLLIGDYPGIRTFLPIHRG